MATWIRNSANTDSSGVYTPWLASDAFLQSISVDSLLRGVVYMPNSIFRSMVKITVYGIQSRRFGFTIYKSMTTDLQTFDRKKVFTWYAIKRGGSNNHQDWTLLVTWYNITVVFRLVVCFTKDLLSQKKYKFKWCLRNSLINTAISRVDTVLLYL